MFEKNKQSVTHGIIFRSFAKTEESVNEVVERAIRSIKKADSLGIFQKIVILIPVDYDCGWVQAGINRWRQEEPNPTRVTILEASGYHSCGALNMAIQYLWENGIEYATVISHKAIEYLEPSIFTKANQAFAKGTKVVGVPVAGLEEIVRAGRVQNTFAIWDTHYFLSTGGFVNEFGVEEMVPIIKLIQWYGKCVSIIESKTGTQLKVRKSADGRARHKEVMSTKIQRQQQEVDRFKVNFAFLEEGIVD